MRTRTKKGETATRVYNLLRRNPNLTTKEIKLHLSDLSTMAVQSMVSRMYQNGILDSRGRRPEVSDSGKTVSQKTYYVKYKPRLQAAPGVQAPKVQAPKVEAPKVEAPKVVGTQQPPWQPPVAKPEPEGPKTPRAEREVVVHRHLADIYKALNQLTEQQDALLAVLKGTLKDLFETKEELDRERQRRNWWDKIKGLFS